MAMRRLVDYTNERKHSRVVRAQKTFKTMIEESRCKQGEQSFYFVQTARPNESHSLVS